MLMLLQVTQWKNGTSLMRTNVLVGPGAWKKLTKKFFPKTIDLFLRMWYYNSVRRGKTLGRGLENVSPTVVIGASR